MNSSEVRTTPNLDDTVASMVNDGYRVESRGANQAVLVKGKSVNHVLQLILTIITFGLWVFVWIGLVLFGGEKRVVVTEKKDAAYASGEGTA